ncbi:MAG: amidohydrolase family protein [Saprospiraceae bacterium]
MKIQSLSIFLILILGSCLHAQQSNSNAAAKEMDFEKYDPPSTLVVPEHKITAAKFPFIDVHSHHWRGMDGAYFQKLKTEMDAMHMQIIVNLSGGTGESLKKMVDSANQYMPGRFVVFANINIRSIDEPDWAENTVKGLENDVKNGAKGLKIYKSQGMDDKDSGGKRIGIDDPRIGPVWEACGRLGIPVLIHSGDPASFWKPADENNERWLELKTKSGRARDGFEASFEQVMNEQHNIFRQHAKTTFIAAHMGWYPNDLGKLADLLDAMPNVNVEIGAVIAELGRQPRFASAFFTKYQNRVLFGKDSYVVDEYPTYFRVLESADEYFPYHKRYHAFWRMYGMNLSDEVLKKVYYKNAMRIIPGLQATGFSSN